MIEKPENNALDLSRGFLICFLIVFLLPFSLNATEVNDSSEVQVPLEIVQDTVSEEERPVWLEMLIWPFSNIIQPALSAAIYPVSTPLKYAFKNRVIDKGVNLISFGKEKNIFIYPTFNLTPGASTQMGVVYRHRNMFLNLDYFVFNFS